MVKIQLVCRNDRPNKRDVWKPRREAELCLADACGALQFAHILLHSNIIEMASRHAAVQASVQSQEEQLLKRALEAESLIDQEISRLASLNTDDLELMRERRMRLMKLEYEQQQQWLAKGHGKYTELQVPPEPVPSFPLLAVSLAPTCSLSIGITIITTY